MASIKISELEEVVTLSESDTLPITNEGDTKQVKISKLGDILATKTYVDNEISSRADMGFTPIIVSELPTTNIKTNTIYMMLGDDGQGSNIYEEWMYISGTWEKVGSTGVSSGSGALGEGVYSIEISNKNVNFNLLWSTSSVGDVWNNFSSTQLNELSDICTSAYQDVLNGIQPVLCITYKYLPTNTSSHQYQFVRLHLESANPTTKPGTLSFRNIGTREDYPKYLWHRELKVTGTWLNNTFTASSATYKCIDLNNLAKAVFWDNTSTVTPTGTYNPATKKYVDDSIKQAITDALGGDY